ncbi:hypothetical protein F4604DRAFT_1906439 [Suillus subluteus]|nr:hypothetical protein F4604DRAFT_1906439 [Suillus subluteus]
MVTGSHISPNEIHRAAPAETGPVVCRNVIPRMSNKIVLRVIAIVRDVAKLPCIACLGLVKPRRPVPSTPRAMFETDNTHRSHWRNNPLKDDDLGEVLRREDAYASTGRQTNSWRIELQPTKQLGWHGLRHGMQQPDCPWVAAKDMKHDKAYPTLSHRPKPISNGGTGKTMEEENE